MTLGPLDSDAAESLARALVTPQTQIDPWAVRRILEITSNQPHYIRLFCRVLLDCCAQRSPLTPSDIEEALPAFFETPQTEFVDAWQSLPNAEQYVLSAFAALKGHGGIATSYEVHKSCTRNGILLALPEVTATLDRLIQRRLLERLGANSYRFALELFRLWVAGHRPPDQVLRDRPWRLRWQSLLGHLGTLGQSLAEHWPRWAIVAGLVVVGTVLILPMLLRATRSYSTSRQGLATPLPAATWTVARVAARATPAPTATSVPAPLVALPGNDLAVMSRANRDAPWQLYAMNSLTGERQRLTKTTSDELTPRWSPDGRKLLFASYRNGEREVYVMDLAAVVQGAGDEAIVNLSRHTAADWQPAWSPDGMRVAFSSYRDGNWEIYAVRADGTDMARLTNDPATDFSPSWSPDGTRLLFMSRRSGDADLFVLDLATSKLTQLTHGKRDEYEPAWSPDGEWMAFVTQMDDQSDIWVMHADGSEPVNLTQSRYADDFSPAWYCGSDWLLYVSYTSAEGNYGVFRMRRDGTGVTRVTESKVDNLAPDWRSVGQCP
jgi:Tol biopolymer transport system component